MDSPRYARPAGGRGHVNTIYDRQTELLNDAKYVRTGNVPMHLRSAFHGAGVSHTSSTRLEVPNSPRYMQSTAASRNTSRPASAASGRAPAAKPPLPLPPGARAGGPTPRDTFEQVDISDDVDVSSLSPAGGPANASMKTEIDLRHPVDGPRRSFRSATSLNGPPARQVPATVESIASPTRGATLESPRAAADARLYESGMYMGGGMPRDGEDMRHFYPEHTGGWVNSDAVARGRLAMPYFTTHDKSLPNARRTQRGSGACLPPSAVASVTHEPGNGTPPAFLTDHGFSSVTMPRLGRAGASIPPPLPPNSNPNEAGAPPPRPTAGYHGMASGSSAIDPLLGGRRRRGDCSPRIERAAFNIISHE